jgi:transposase
MANYLKMAQVQAILQLKDRGWSNRRIERELGIHRETVSRYLRLREQQSGQVVTGQGRTTVESVAGSAMDGVSGAPLGDSNPSKAPPGSDPDLVPIPPGSTSQCVEYHRHIVSLLRQELSARRIYQDLVAEHNFSGSYYSVRRYVGKLRRTNPLPFRRLECSAGMEAQIDFGTATSIIMPNGKRKRSHVFRIVLSCSRKAYSETVFHQTTDNFLRCLENAFWYFGGVPQTIVIDNLKAAVSKADWYDPEIVPKLQSFCAHYGTAILPTKPYMPRHKGKVENGIKYVKSNALKGRRFHSLNEQNDYLIGWEQNTADKRIHGTTRQQVEKVFQQKERPALQELPSGYFPSFQEARRSVHRDGHVEVDKSYYSVPPEYVGRKVWVRWDSRLVRIFNHKMEQIALHSKVEPGRFQTNEQHLHQLKRCGIENGEQGLLQRTRQIGNY